MRGVRDVAVLAAGRAPARRSPPGRRRRGSGRCRWSAASSISASSKRRIRSIVRSWSRRAGRREVGQHRSGSCAGGRGQRPTHGSHDGGRIGHEQRLQVRAEGRRHERRARPARPAPASSASAASPTRAAISAPKPAVHDRLMRRRPARPVRPTDAERSCRCPGAGGVRRSMTSASMPSAASVSAAAMAVPAMRDQATMVTSRPGRRIDGRADRDERASSPSGTSPLRPVQAAVLQEDAPGRRTGWPPGSRPWASAGVDGATTVRPGTCVNQASRLWL